ncbi:hypothetical protein AAMO2058_001723200 [Amorphochlora amoebiformis]
MTHINLSDGWTVNTTIPIQSSWTGGLKKYTIVYFVFEKEASCEQYPSDGSVTFSKIRVEYDNQQVKPKWETSHVEDVCNNRAKVLDPYTIKITWDTSMDNNRTRNTPQAGLVPFKARHNDLSTSTEL